MSGPDPFMLVQELLLGTREVTDGCSVEDETFLMIRALGPLAVPALEEAILDERNLARKLKYGWAVVLYTELAAAHAPDRLEVIAAKLNPMGRDEMARVLGWKEVAGLPNDVFEALIRVFRSEPAVYRQWVDNLVNKGSKKV